MARNLHGVCFMCAVMAAALFSACSTDDAPNPPPSAPVGVTAEALSANSVEIKWTPVSDAVEYIVYRGNTSIGDNITGAPYTDSGLSPSTPYSYQVAAKNKNGTSNRSAVVSVTTQAPPLSDPETPTDSATRVTFENNTQFSATIHRDAFSGPVVLELEPGTSDTIDAAASENYGIGSTYCVTYQFNVTDADDTYSGQVFADGLDPNAQINFVIEDGKSYTRQIPVPEGISINSAYLRIHNKSSAHFELARLGMSQKQAGNEELPVPAGKTGVYKFEVNNTLNFSDYRLQSVFQEISVPAFVMEKGYVYDFVFTNEGGVASVFLDTKWRIKPEPTTKWNKPVSESEDGYFSDSDLAAHLETNVRLGLSDLRDGYPVSKIIERDNILFAAEMSFTLFVSDIAETGFNGRAFEMPLLNTKDGEWAANHFVPQYFYAGTLSRAYHTVFNDIIALNDGTFVVLATYFTANRSGIWLFFINQNGECIDEVDIPPSADMTTSFMGTRLCASDDGGFLLIGAKKEYDDATAEFYTTSKAILYKYQNNGTSQWQQEYAASGSSGNTGIYGVETNGAFAVIAIANIDDITKTVLLTLNTAGAIVSDRQFGSSSGNMIPYSLSRDANGNLFITGLLHGELDAKAYIMKLDSAGNQLWLKQYGNKNSNLLFDALVSGNSLIAVGSSSNGGGGDFAWQYGSGWILKIDTNTGIVISDINSANSAITAFNSIIQRADGGYILSGLKSRSYSNSYLFDTLAIKTDEHLRF